MLALPAEPGPVGLALLVVGLAIGLGASLLVWRPLGGALGRSRAARLTTALLGLATAVAIAAAPYVSWRVVEDIRYTSRLTAAEAERSGASQNFLDPSVFDDLRTILPSGDTYYIASSPRFSDRAAGAFALWSATALLPRIRVSDPRRADWVVTWGFDPRRLGVPVEDIRALGGGPGTATPVSYVARVRS